jgi:2-oxoglutarate ferredoxin oxidoreductase subunit alpha
MRGGPGLGGIQPSQADYWQATRALGHGDAHLVVVAPATVQEMADMVATAFHLADCYRTPVMVLADGMLGQMMEPVTLPAPVDPADIPAKPWALTGRQGRTHANVANSLELIAENLERKNLDRFQRYHEIEAKEQRAETYLTEDADYVVVAFGACARVAHSAVDQARAEGIKVGLLRPITLWPFPKQALEALIPQTKSFLTVEMNMGQMVDDVRLVVEGRRPVAFFGHTGGIIPTPAEVAAEVKRLKGGLS